jgi:V/A-type H+-transporting ATPase subunit I
VIGNPLYRLLFGKRPVFAHGFGTFIMEGIVEIIETFSYFLGNTVSFVRVGAFALAHSGLSSAVIALTGLVGPGLPAVLVLIFGNLLIIVLEGMVVTIQTLRLEYYEFFSKFYSGNGRPFKPLSLPSHGGHPIPHEEAAA